MTQEATTQGGSLELDGWVVIVTGGARGQGAAEARSFVEAGAHVIVADVLEREGRETAERLGPSATFQLLDVADEEAWTGLVTDVVRREGRIDGLVNNAGILHVQRIETETVDAFRRVLEINVLGAFIGMRAVIPVMRDAHRGSIVNVSSLAGLVGFSDHAAYSASKFALRGLTRSAAIELGPAGIRVNSVHPGIIDTPMLSPAALNSPDRIPIGRNGTPDDIAEAVFFLVSDRSRYMSGTEVVVDGGLGAGPAGRRSG